MKTSTVVIVAVAGAAAIGAAIYLSRRKTALSTHTPAPTTTADKVVAAVSAGIPFFKGLFATSGSNSAPSTSQAPIDRLDDSVLDATGGVLFHDD